MSPVTPGFTLSARSFTLSWESSSSCVVVTLPTNCSRTKMNSSRNSNTECSESRDCVAVPCRASLAQGHSSGALAASAYHETWPDKGRVEIALGHLLACSSLRRPVRSGNSDGPFTLLPARQGRSLRLDVHPVQFLLLSSPGRHRRFRE